MKAHPKDRITPEQPGRFPTHAAGKIGPHSIRTRLLMLAFGLALAPLVVVIIAAAQSSTTVFRQVQQITSRSLRTQAESYLVQINESVASQSALVLDRAARDIQSLADSSSALFSDRMTLPDTYVGMTVGPEQQLMNSPEDVSSVFVPSVVWKATNYNPELYQAIQRDIELSSYLDLTLPSIKENNPNAGAVYLGTTHDVLRYFPNIRIGEVVPADFQVTQRPWYITAVEGNQGKQKMTPVWSPVYYDATGLGLVTTIAVPVVTDAGALVGVVGLDVTLTEVQDQIENSGFLDTGYSFLVDETGNAIVLPPQGYQDILDRNPNPEQPTPNLLQETDSEALQVILGRMIASEQGFSILSLGGRELYVAFTPVRSVTGGEMIIPGWSLASVVAAEDVLANVSGLEAEIERLIQNLVVARLLPIGAIIALVLIASSYVVTNRLVNPILKLARSAQQLGSGDWEGPAPVLIEVQRKNQDEIGLLAGALTAMAGHLRQSFEQLEQRVADRTRSLEQRSLQLQTAAEVSGRITQAQDLDALLKDAVNLISQRFGYYNVGIFLVDDTSEYAYLKAASGDVGQKLLERELRLRVGGESRAGEGFIGYVTRFGQPRLTGDVSADRMYVAEPLLAAVRSELTLPLRSGPKIVGALDVQSTEPMAFSEEDVTVLQTLADQLAIAIENVRLVARMQATLVETQTLFQQDTRQGWRRLLAQSGQIGFEYDRLEVRRLPEEDLLARAVDPGAAKSPADPSRMGNVIKIPVRLRGNVIGVIGLESDDPDHQWTEDELAIIEATASQAALSVENARLLSESRRLAAREQITAEVTARLRASLDMRSVLQSAVQAIAEQLNLPEVAVELTPVDAIEPGEDDSTPTAGRAPGENSPSGAQGDSPSALISETPLYERNRHGAD